MLRTQISLTDDERQLLERESVRTGRSMSALIRDAVNLTYRQGRSEQEDVAALNEGFGAWGETEIDGHGIDGQEIDGEEIDGEEWVERLRSGRRLLGGA